MRTSFITALFEQPRIMRNLALRSNFWIVLLFDITLIVLAHILAYAVRFDFEVFGSLQRGAGILPLLIVVKIPVFYCFGLYRGMWRYTSIADLISIAKAVAVSSGLLIMTVLYMNRFAGFSRSVFFMDGIFCFLLISSHRGAIRFVMQSNELLTWFRIHDEQRKRPKRLLLVGAGAAAEKVIREIRDNLRVPYEIVGLVDDDTKKQGLKIHGYTVVGGINSLSEAASHTGAEELLIAIASATGEEMKRIVEACRLTELPFKVLPSISEIINGRLSVSAIRDVDYRDLLGRPVVDLDQEEICNYLTDQTILITGAGGSIGSELCRQIIRFDPKKIILLDSGEENLYKIQMEFEHDIKFRKYAAVLGNCNNRELLESIYLRYKPAVVFHAAAYKHVPLVETNPWEGISNNVFGLKTLIEVAIKYQTERFVLVSTDKAVRPTNIMGATKRITELIMHAYCHEQFGSCVGENSGQHNHSIHKMACMAVRFGNVLGSSGSVIPLFKRQIEMGGPITVTHPDITRYFMSIDEAAQLILQAGAMGERGEIFLLKMGYPVKINDMAHDLVKLMGLEPGIDIPIIYTGLRPGEKLYEELITAGEGVVPTHHEKIMVLRGGEVSIGELEIILNDLKARAQQFDIDGIKEVVLQLVPEYMPDTHSESIIGRCSEQLQELKN
jgi:FlaA1/EpsC-like NDP-sugar epimerase